MPLPDNSWTRGAVPRLMRSSGTWSPGSTIVLQEVWHGKLWSARPMIVVQDHSDLLVLWYPRMTMWKAPTTPPFRPRAATRADRFVESLTRGDWVFADITAELSSLVLLRPGDWHGLLTSWDETGEYLGWYVNFQRPYMRTPSSIQTMDLMLDIVVAPDRTWRWKDQDEFDVVVAAGLIGRAEADRVRTEAATVIARIEANEEPFNQPWHDWRPDPTWTVATLPPGWDRVTL